jgi:hypothetical protein
MTMSLKTWIVALAALSLTVTVADAGTKKHRHHVRAPAPAPADAVWPFASRHDEPAHFVRLPNGLIVSSYQCFFDAGYGRYTPCDLDGGRP